MAERSALPVGAAVAHAADLQSAAAISQPGRSSTQMYAEGRSAGALSCPRCGADSAPDMRFCRECGAALDGVVRAPPTALPPACARCGSGRDVDALFCRHCGASFKDAGAPLSGFTPPQSAYPGLAAAQPAPAAAGPRLVTLLKDGSEGRSIPLADHDADIGGSEGEITFPDDPYLSPRHARVMCRVGTYSVRDLDSVNGVYVRLRQDAELRDQDMMLVGQQVLRFELLSDGELPLGPAFQRGVMVFGTPEAARFARLVQYTTEGVARDVHYLFRDETVIGRENGDIVFTDDPFLSRRHVAVRVDHAGRRFTLHDLGSSNGTALRIRGDHVLKDGDQFRIGRHLFRFEAGPAGGRVGR
jgi:pSer/pThr/pTyr-binding forkhead associated (FHA) protein/ribosomal protein L40E